MQLSLSRGLTSRLEEAEPESRSGRRRIALSTSVVESLRRHRVRQLEYRLSVGDAYEDRDYVFINETGDHIHPNTLYRRFYDLRHTSATLLLAEGVHGKIVQERIGHANIAMTLDFYSHVTADMQREAVDRLNVRLNAAS